mmetsp:Transcript_1988/g.4907  ORF Transcript_1988/g.4907 Transcript_1988/m.4907 type:complete len:131 (-) Transcript_1988:5-397(-)
MGRHENDTEQRQTRIGLRDVRVLLEWFGRVHGNSQARDAAARHADVIPRSTMQTAVTSTFSFIHSYIHAFMRRCLCHCFATGGSLCRNLIYQRTTDWAILRISYSIQSNLSTCVVLRHWGFGTNSHMYYQ